MNRRISPAFVCLLFSCASGEAAPPIEQADAPQTSTAPAEPVDADHDGYPATADCDDAHMLVHPGAPESCNGKDDDCNGKVDDVPAKLAGPLSDPHWALAGSAAAVEGWQQLTNAPYQSGAAWWDASYRFDRFDAHATFWIEAKPDGADGLAFAWVPGSDVEKAGGLGGAMGTAPLGGWAVAIDTYANADDPPAPFLSLLDGTTGESIARQGLPNVRDGREHALAVRLDAGKVSAWVDGVLYFHEIPLPGYAPFTGHWGLTAATGVLGEAHAVKDVTMTFPDGQGCVP
jgi:hypothetical protein